VSKNAHWFVHFTVQYTVDYTCEWINDLKTRQLLWIRLYTHLPIASATMKKILEIRFNMSVVWIGFVKIAFHGLYIYYAIWYICILYKFKKTEARGPLSVFLSLSRVIFLPPHPAASVWSWSMTWNEMCWKKKEFGVNCWW